MQPGEKERVKAEDHYDENYNHYRQSKNKLNKIDDEG